MQTPFSVRGLPAYSPPPATIGSAQLTSALAAGRSATRATGGLESSVRADDRRQPSLVSTTAELSPGQQVEPGTGVDTAGKTKSSVSESNTADKSQAGAAGRLGSEENGLAADESGESAGEKTQRLDEVELALIKDLASRDREVRTHEQAHAAIGGVHAGSPTYSYTRGPDGRQYATGGEVSIDVSPILGDPAATIQKMQQVARAALAPAEPSAADRSVAAAAQQSILQAQAELAADRALEAKEAGSQGEGSVKIGDRAGPEAEDSAKKPDVYDAPGAVDSSAASRAAIGMYTEIFNAI